LAWHPASRLASSLAADLITPLCAVAVVEELKCREKVFINDGYVKVKQNKIKMRKERS
jgi:F0F1-type ATP synthase epsilon subunit